MDNISIKNHNKIDSLSYLPRSSSNEKFYPDYFIWQVVCEIACHLCNTDIVLRNEIKCCRLNTVKEVERLNKGRAIFDDNEKIGDGLYRIRDSKQYHIRDSSHCVLSLAQWGFFMRLKVINGAFEIIKISVDIIPKNSYYY